MPRPLGRGSLHGGGEERHHENYGREYAGPPPPVERSVRFDDTRAHGKPLHPPAILSHRYRQSVPVNIGRRRRASGWRSVAGARGGGDEQRSPCEAVAGGGAGLGEPGRGSTGGEVRRYPKRDPDRPPIPEPRTGRTRSDGRWLGREEVNDASTWDGEGRCSAGNAGARPVDRNPSTRTSGNDAVRVGSRGYSTCCDPDQSIH